MRGLKHRGVQFGVLMGVLLATGWQMLPLLLGPEIDGLPVTRGDLVQDIAVAAQLQQPEQYDITALQTGKVAKLAVATGDSVKAGQLLLAMDNSRERAQLAEAKKAVALAQLRFNQAREKLRTGSDRAVDQSKISLNNARKQYTRISDLAARGLVSQSQAADALRNLAITQNQLNNAQFQAKASRAQGSEYAMADSALKNARELEKTAQLKLADTELHSLHDGVVKATQIEQGQSVKAGMVVMQLASAASTQIKLALPPEQKNLIKPGAVIRLDDVALGNIPAEFDQAQAEASLVIKLDASLQEKQRDKPLQLQIEVAHLQDVLSLEASAIHDAQGNQPWVMAVQDGKAQRRNIRVGMIGHINAKDRPRMQVLEGLREGDIVLPLTAQNIEEGRRIRLARNG